MARVSWGTAGNRIYEIGVDRGVVYPADGSSGQSWPGLVSVTESNSSAAVTPYYLDGMKILQTSSLPEYSATVVSIQEPYALQRAAGSRSISNGLYVTNQKPLSFGFTYRTLIGNDTVGTDRGYKIHIVYNCMATSADKTYNSMTDSPQLMQKSWNITTVPIIETGIVPTSHVFIDSRNAPASALEDLENLLYGSESSNPTLPSYADLLDLFT